MKKNIFIIIIVFLINLTCLFVFADSDISAKLNANKSVKINDDFEVKINIENNTGLSALLFKVKWDDNVFKLQEESINKENSVFKNGTFLTNSEANFLTIIWFDLNGCKSNGELIRFNLKAICNDNLTSEIYLLSDYDNTIDLNEECVDVYTNNVIVEIIDGSSSNNDSNASEIIKEESIVLNPSEIVKIKTEADVSLNWSSSNENVVKVNNGKLIPVNEGDAVVTVESNDGQLIDRLNVKITNDKNILTNYYLLFSIIIFGVSILFIILLSIYKRRKTK